VIIEWLLDLVRVVFLQPLTTVLPLFQADWSAAPLGEFVGEVNAVFPIYWPLFLAGVLVQTALLLLPVVIAVWLWKVAKP
jgi:hypothetical protein